MSVGKHAGTNAICYGGVYWTTERRAHLLMPLGVSPFRGLEAAGRLAV